MYGYEERREESTWTVKKIMKWAGAVLGAIILLVLIFREFIPSARDTAVFW